MSAVLTQLRLRLNTILTELQFDCDTQRYSFSLGINKFEKCFQRKHDIIGYTNLLPCSSVNNQAIDQHLDVLVTKLGSCWVYHPVGFATD